MADGPYMVAIVAVGLLAAGRLAGSGLVASADGELHLYRVFILDRALQHGLWFPRVLPDLLFGYGYPLFNFYPPASTYFVALLRALGLGFLGALNVAFGASFVLAGLAMYGFARTALAACPGLSPRRAAPAGAFAAAGAYVLAPYFLINVYTRGALAEVLAMALLPALLLATHRSLADGGTRAATVLAALCALLILTHSALAIFFLPVVVGYGLVARWIVGRRIGVSVFIRLIGALLLGLAISAFFWLPATLDRPHVSTANLQTGFYDVHRNFLGWAELLAGGLFYPVTTPLPIPPRLGWLQALSAAGGLLLLLRRGPHRLPLAFWVVVAALALFMMTPASAGLWQALPLVAGLSFPWRLLALAALACAMLAGTLALALPFRLGQVAALVLVAGSALVALPGIAPERRSITEAEIDLARYWRFEFETSLVGTTSANEYLPRALSAGSYVLPRVPEESYRDQERDGGLDAAVRLLEANAGRLRMHVVGAERSTIVSHAVYFPGWQASIDGLRVTPYPSTALGLVTVDVPPGEHELVLTYVASDAALAGDVISVAGIVVWLLALALGLRPLFAPLGHTRDARTARRLRPYGAFGLLVVLGLAVALVTQLDAGPREVIQRPAGSGALSEDIDLIGWSPPIDRAGALRFTLHWLARRTPARNEVVVVTLRDARGVDAARWERHPRYGFTPTLRWVAGEVVPDEYALPVPPDLGRAEYTVVVGFRSSPKSLALGKTMVGPGRSAPASPPAPRHLTELRAGEGMRLLGYDLAASSGLPSTGAVAPGEELHITLLWQSLAAVERDYTVFLHLVDASGNRRAGHDAQPADGRRPTVLWQPGEVIADRHQLAIPPYLSPGRYQLLLGAYARPELTRLALFDGQGRPLGDSAPIGTIEVR